LGSVEVVVVPPLLELVVEDLGVVDHGSVEEPVELLGIDAVRTLHFAVEPGCAARLDERGRGRQRGG
jgi:hypothetical protein